MSAEEAETVMMKVRLGPEDEDDEGLMGGGWVGGCGVGDGGSGVATIFETWCLRLFDVK